MLQANAHFKLFHALQDPIASALVRSLQTCPDIVSLRKELLVATRHVLSTPLKAGELFPSIRSTSPTAGYYAQHEVLRVQSRGVIVVMQASLGSLTCCARRRRWLGIAGSLWSSGRWLSACWLSWCTMCAQSCRSRSSPASSTSSAGWPAVPLFLPPKHSSCVHGQVDHELPIAGF